MATMALLRDTEDYYLKDHWSSLETYAFDAGISIAQTRAQSLPRPQSHIPEHFLFLTRKPRDFLKISKAQNLFILGEI